MTAYIAIPDPVTPAWLTAVLRQAGLLQQGEVVAVEQGTMRAFNSQIHRLLLRYSADATSELPASLILKRNNESTWGKEVGADEVKFYQVTASLPDHPPILIPCYAAAYDEASGNSYLLLQDLSETHRPPVTRDQQIGIKEAVPSAIHIEQVVDALARLHAYWWEHPLLHTATFEVGYWSRNEGRFELYRQRRTNSWRRVIEREEVWFPDDLRTLYEQILANLRHHWEQYIEPRFRTRTNLTLTHGDTYFANFLCPKEPATGTAYLLDWQSASFDLAGYDLVNLIAPFWTSEQRRKDQREDKILRRYYNVLQAQGVTGYSWDDLITDYRASLVDWLLIPIQDAADGSRKDYWWPKMQCLAAAFRDWRCDELL